MCEWDQCPAGCHRVLGVGLGPVGDLEVKILHMFMGVCARYTMCVFVTYMSVSAPEQVGVKISCKYLYTLQANFAVFGSELMQQPQKKVNSWLRPACEFCLLGRGNCIRLSDRASVKFSHIPGYQSTLD